MEIENKNKTLKKFLRILRAENNEQLLDMAKKMNISVSYLSSIENNKRKIPKDFFKNLLKEYNLDKKLKRMLINVEKEEKYNEIIKFCKDKNITKKELYLIYKKYK